MTPDIPDGYAPLARTSPVLDLVGPFYSKGEGAALSVGMRVEARHCNARGTLHGGILATLADVALGYATAFASDPPVPLVTANLSLDFAGSAKVGDWIATSVDVHKQGSRLAFANCFIESGGQRIVRASAVFLVTDRPGGATGQASRSSPAAGGNSP